MATTNHPNLKNHKGKISNVAVVKQYPTVTVITGYPDRSDVVYSPEQNSYKSLFAEAVAYAQSIINDPVKKAAYNKLLPKGKRLYNAAIQEFFNPQSLPFSNIKSPVKKRGQIAKPNTVTKRYENKEVITMIPDMSRVVYNESQKMEQSRFAKAIAYAKTVLADLVKKAAFQNKLPKGKRVFNAAIKQYMEGLAGD